MDGFEVDLLTPEAEIAAGQGELVRGQYLAELLRVMYERAKQYNVHIDCELQFYLLSELALTSI